MREQRVILEHDTDFALIGGNAGNRRAINEYFAAVGREEPGNQIEQRCLAAAGWSQQRHEFSALHL